MSDCVDLCVWIKTPAAKFGNCHFNEDERLISSSSIRGDAVIGSLSQAERIEERNRTNSSTQVSQIKCLTEKICTLITERKKNITSSVVIHHSKPTPGTVPILSQPEPSSKKKEEMSARKEPSDHYVPVFLSEEDVQTDSVYSESAHSKTVKPQLYWTLNVFSGLFYDHVITVNI